MSLTTQPTLPFAGYMTLLSMLIDTTIRQNARSDRTGTGTASMFGDQLTFDLNTAFPLLPWRPVHLVDVLRELAWFLEGSIDVNRLKALGSNIWNQWALPTDQKHDMTMSPYGRASHYAETSGKSLDSVIQELQALGDMENGHKHLDTLNVPRTLEHTVVQAGSIGPMYGAQWRKWRSVTIAPQGNVHREDFDQVKKLIHDLTHNPYSRRHIISAWNVAYLPSETMTPHDNVRAGKMAIAPCHQMVQFYVVDLSFEQRLEVFHANRVALEDEGIRLIDAAYLDKQGVPLKGLSAKVHMRSCDIMLGAPYNIASYATLVHLLCAKLGMAPQKLIMSFGDLHLYSNHLDAAIEMHDRYTNHMENPDYAYSLSPKFYAPEGFDITSFMGKTNEFGEILVEEADVVKDKLVVLAGGLTDYNPYPKLKAAIPIAV